MTIKTVARNLKEYNKIQSYKNPRFQTEFTGLYENGRRLYQDTMISYNGNTVTIGKPYHITYNQDTYI